MVYMSANNMMYPIQTAIEKNMPVEDRIRETSVWVRMVVALPRFSASWACMGSIKTEW